ncbi:cytochrome P450 714C2-like isoform X2 [Salvia hispanica]|uniref:cytochrome P450 714C2-like isoform X2 n=1 Tax=Salvia hispanica TaxID=49212 RepID=UPI0020090B6E|nr:cytochrome P450 714C2-like isoform X2 [Salvia hispanica]
MTFLVMEKHFLLQIIVSIALASILALIFRLYKALVVAPRLLRHALKQQGVGGPPPSFLLGNIIDIKNSRASPAAAAAVAAAAGSPASHNCEAILFSAFNEWRQLYDLEALLGNGIVTANGNSWAYQRKILAPELFIDKVKGMTNLIEQSTLMLIESWKGLIEAEGGKADIKIDDYLKKFSGEVISRACFGSSYAEGEQLFQKLAALQQITAKKGFSLGIPGMRHVPTKHNRSSWRLQRDIRELILALLKQKNEENMDKNMLGMILKGAAESNSKPSPDAITKFTIDNCKSIYFAGFETTAIVASWCLMLLASNPEWQHRVREEVVGICRRKPLDFDSLRHMKQLTMVINESLRLYPPVGVLAREAVKEMEFSGTRIPKGVTIWILIITLHTDPDIWGPDSYQFKPERFANGTAGACKLPHLFMPFGFGPRICLGLNLAMLELKILVAHILSNFSFSLSPNYVHAPAMNLVMEPGNGVRLVIQNLDAAS